MSRRHVDDESFALAVGYALERSGHPLVVCAGDKCRPDFLHELDELLLAEFPALEPFESDELRLKGTQVALGELPRVDESLNILE